MTTISKIYQTENVAAITFENAPANIDFVHEVFSQMAASNINVDMISQTVAKGTTNTLSFTTSDENVTEILKILHSLSKRYDFTKPLVTSSNVKISLFSENMAQTVGVAADVFAKLNSKSIDIMLITTSDVDISILVSSANADDAYTTLAQDYLK